MRVSVWMIPAPTLRAGSAVVLLSSLMASLASAQSGSPNLYQPKLTAQAPPMRAEVIDGARFRDIETKTTYRLAGIDTCAPGQTARLGRQPWPCGTMATAWLVGATLNKWVSCTTIRDDGRDHVVRCATATLPDLPAAMLRGGVAVQAQYYDGEPVIRDYSGAEQQARKAYRGLWSSTFQMPWEWRALHDRVPSAGGAEGPEE